MAHRIEVAFKEGVRDALGEGVRKRIVEHLGFEVNSVKTIDVYTIDAELDGEQLQELGENLFADSVTQVFSCGKPLAKDFDYLIEVGFRPGVTDNAGNTSRKAAEDILKKTVEGVYTSKQYLLRGKLDKQAAEEIARGFLANELIERWEVKSSAEFDFEKGMELVLPIVRLKYEVRVEPIDLNVSDGELMRISKERVLALSLPEMKAARDYFKNKRVNAERKKLGLGEEPTDVELEALAQTWSEHCKHKIFNALINYDAGNGKTLVIDSLFDTYVRKSTEEIGKSRKFMVSVFSDNAGVIKFNEDYNLVMKVETHNSPSALDPYGGAITGIVGVNRDPLGTGMGAKLIFNTDVFCFAPPDYTDKLPPRLLHPKRIFEGVRKGVEHGGNKSGIPTVNGCLVFDPRFLGKPLVYCGTGGLMPSVINGRESHLKKADAGDLIVMTGGRIGKDGVHGATFSSEELHEGSPATAVQIGDPITQKKMADFILEARDLGLYKSITDNGAGGLSCSVGEMAKESGGCELHLEKAPLKYAGLHPWEILLSEAQERMTLAVAPEKINEFMELAKGRDVEATVLGEFTDSGWFHILYEGKTVAYVDMDFLHNGSPQMKLNAKWEQKIHEEPDFEEPRELTDELKKMLGRLNICSKEYVVRQYDHEVQGGSVVKPLVGVKNDGPSDSAVVQPLLDSLEGVVVANGIAPRYSDIDAYHMCACAIDEAIRNNIAVGGSLEHMAMLDNFCWCDPVKSEKTPDGEYKLAQLVRANQALYDYTTAFSVPCISGKDSMKNDYIIQGVKISIPPTILISTVSKIDDVRKTATMDVKKPGDLIYVLGTTRNELGGSEYFAAKGFMGNNVPKVDAEKAVKLYEAVSKAIKLGLIKSCHDCADGGLGITLAESAFSGGRGVEVDLSKVPREGIERSDYLLFSESPSRFVVTIRKEDKKAFEEILKGNAYAEIGYAREDNAFVVTGLNQEIVVNADVQDLKQAWQKTLGW
ncbi:phosphoribosylformylglycinamidine synthase subunit PurL [Candidatus Micrarchaeota archaeon]|nr:phosphoribosylformylglycinamidine synthase subunit PurL [Candidatus Micrarchaeota archaeon]